MSAFTQDNPPTTWWYLPFIETNAHITTTTILGMMAASLLLSLVIFMWSVASWARKKSGFNLGIVSLSLGLLANDIYYFVAVAITPMPAKADDKSVAFIWEMIRGVSYLVVSTQLAGLSLFRFHVFSETTFAAWYSVNLRNALLFVNYGLALAVGAFMGVNYAQLPWPHHDQRCVYALSAVFIWTLFIDMSIMIATFAIVMRIQRQIGSKYKDLRSSIARVITALCFMGLCAGGALFAYVGSQSFLHSPEPPGSTYWGGSIGGIIARLYGLCTMYVWYTIINIVRGRTHESKDSVPSFGDLRLQQGSALEKPMPTHYGSAPRPTYTGISIQQQQLQQQVASLRYSDQSQHQYPQQPDVYSMSVRGPSSQYSTQQPQQQQQQQQHPASQYSLSIRVPSQQYPSQSRGSQLNVQYGSQSRYQEPPTSPSVMSWHSDSRYSVAPRAPTQSHVGN